MIMKKKQILTATLLIALTAAVAVNWYYTNNPVVTSPDETTDYYAGNDLGDSLLVAGTVMDDTESADITASVLSDNISSDTYFSEAKLKREQGKDEVIEEIEDFLEDDSLGSQEKTQISDMLTEFKDTIKRENDIENLIKAKTSGQVLVVINDGSGSVVVEKGTLNDTLVMQITDIFEKNTGISAENLTIIEAK